MTCVNAVAMVFGIALERPQSELAASMPSVDVIDRDNEVVVRAAVPGYKKEEKGDYYRCEISQGSFSRAIALPAEVDESKAKASMTDGMLELVLPKLEKSKRHTISIS